MPKVDSTLPDSVEYSVLIGASPARIWEALTNIAFMKQWMAEPEMRLDIVTDWTVGHPFVMRGFHHVAFENTGSVLQFDPPHHLQYSHRSSISHLRDEPRNQTIFDFRLVPEENRTSLTLTLRNFPTEAIFKHLDFYWRVTLGILKEFVERDENALK